MNYYIYVIKLYDIVLYIGRTNNPKARWSHHKFHETNELMKKYFSIYPLEDFYFEIIYDNLTYEQAKKIETELIQENQKNNIYLTNADIGDRKSFLSKDRISISLKRFWNSKRAEGLKTKLANANKNRKKIFDTESKLFFNSITEAAKRLNVSRNTIYYRIQQNKILYM